MAVAKVKSAELVKTTNSTPPATREVAPSFLAPHRTEDAGKGFGHKAEDTIIPFIDVLAVAACPQLKPKNEKFIPGAEIGDILIRGALNPIAKGNEGIIIQPCAFERVWVEWIPRSKGGGFVTRHASLPPDAVERPNPEDETKTMLIRKSNGNVMVDTRYHYVLYNGMPFVMAFKSTGHTVSREWTNLIKLLGGGNNAVAFERKYHITTKLKTRNQNEWYIFSVADAGYVKDEEEYLAGRALYAAVMSGERVAAEEEAPEGGGGEGDM